MQFEIFRIPEVAKDRIIQKFNTMKGVDLRVEDNVIM